MSFKRIGSCSECGAPKYVPSAWMGVFPPTPQSFCGCDKRNEEEKKALAEGLAINAGKEAAKKVLEIREMAKKEWEPEKESGPTFPGLASLDEAFRTEFSPQKTNLEKILEKLEEIEARLMLIEEKL